MGGWVVDIRSEICSTFLTPRFSALTDPRISYIIAWLQVVILLIGATATLANMQMVIIAKTDKLIIAFLEVVQFMLIK